MSGPAQNPVAPRPPAWVLAEDEALELLAYLVTAARTQLD
jgi:hypothetical protein